MPDISTIERLPDESARAYAARVEYVTMGEARSTAKVGQRLGKSKDLMDRWSARYGWQDTARAWDDQQAAARAALASEQYRRDLEAHRKESMEAGKALFTVASQLTIAINQALNGPREIEGKDGKRYTLHKIDLSANTFQIAAKAMQVALDLKAHALGIDRILIDDSE